MNERQVFDEWGQNAVDDVARAIAGAEGFDWFTISGADAARWRYIATRAIAALVPHHIERQRMTVECVMNVEPHEAARLIHDELGKRMRRNAGVA